MAVLAPIPSVIVRTETAVKTGDFSSWRNVWRTPCAKPNTEALPAGRAGRSNPLTTILAVRLPNKSGEPGLHLHELRKELPGRACTILSGTGDQGPVTGQ